MNWRYLELLKPTVELEREQMKMYLTGESIRGDYPPDWLLVQYEDCITGWAKSVKGRLNNLYPKGLRIYNTGR